MNNSRVVITGANRGIGLALVNEYLKQGASVTALCRHTSTELDSSGAEIIQGVDVTDTGLADLLHSQLGDTPIDVLINNAGLLASESLGEIDYQTLQQQFEINAVGPLRVTEAILPLLAKGAKVGLITSRMGSIADNGSGGYYGYRMSKAALNAAGMSLARDLQPRGIAVAILHPGFVQTRMVGFSGDVSPEVCAARLVQRMEELTLATTGSFWHANGEVLPW